MISIADSHGDIISVLESELKKNDVVIVTGGHGAYERRHHKTCLAALSEPQDTRRMKRQRHHS